MLKVVETFSGIGSQAKALSKLNIDYKITAISEWDISAFYAYDIIHNGPQDLTNYEKMSKERILEILDEYELSTNGKEPAKMNYLKTWPVNSLRKVLCALNRTHNLGSITRVTADKLPKKIDLLTYSFPCQDLSICGSWHGNMTGIDRNADNRSGMLWEIERILYECRDTSRSLPTFLLMENVKNILSPTHKPHFEDWQRSLRSLGYINQVYTLNAVNFSSPQKRVRTYMLSVLCKTQQQRTVVTKYFEMHNLQSQPPQAPAVLSDYLRVDYSNEKYRVEAERSNPNDTPSRRLIFENNDCVFDGIKTTTNTIKTLTTKQDRNPTSGLVLYPEHAEGKSQYRNFTPRECFMFMGFDEMDYENLAASGFDTKKGSSLYSRERYERLAGNSIVVDVLVAIFKQVDELQAELASVPHTHVHKNKPLNNKRKRKTAKKKICQNENHT